jgi:hypothetical protein
MKYKIYTASTCTIVLLLGIFRRPPLCPFTSLKKILLAIMIPAPSGSHLKCLKWVKTYGKHFIDPSEIYPFFKFFLVRRKLPFFGLDIPGLLKSGRSTIQTIFWDRTLINLKVACRSTLVHIRYSGTGLKDIKIQSQISNFHWIRPL